MTFGCLPLPCFFVIYQYHLFPWRNCFRWKDKCGDFVVKFISFYIEDLFPVYHHCCCVLRVLQHPASYPSSSFFDKWLNLMLKFRAEQKCVKVSKVFRVCVCVYVYILGRCFFEWNMQQKINGKMNVDFLTSSVFMTKHNEKNALLGKRTMGIIHKEK